MDPDVENRQESTSPYSYVFNNPIKNTDPDGRDPDGPGDGDTPDLIRPTSEHFRHEHPILAVIHDIAYKITGLKDLENSIGHLRDKNISTQGKVDNVVQATVNVLSLGEDGEGEGFHGEGPKIEMPEFNSLKEVYKRPSNATTKAQRASVQGEPCVTCGEKSDKMVADHKKELVKEHYETGTIDKKRMRSKDAVQPQCPTCSAKQGAEMSKYSKEQKKLHGFN